MGVIRVATHNFPHRMDRDGRERRASLARLEDEGVTIAGYQESTDGGFPLPSGWAMWRPKQEASSVVVYLKSEWDVVARGSYKLSSSGDPLAPRYIVWVWAKNTRTRYFYRFGSLHLPAFKTSIRANGIEYRHQEERAAKWLGHHGARRLLVGDFNGSPRPEWQPNLIREGIVCEPLLSTGPSNWKLDQVWRPKGQDVKRPRTVKAMNLGSDHKALICDVED